MNFHIGLVGGTAIALVLLILAGLLHTLVEVAKFKDRRDLAAEARRTFKDENEVVAALLAFTAVLKWSLFGWAATVIWVIFAFNI